LKFAVDSIDELLLHDPLNHGEEREDNERLLFVAPVGLRYKISADDCMVTVTHIWPVRARE
jgi:hypothetical protein